MGQGVKFTSLSRFCRLVASLFPCTHHSTFRQENNTLIAMVIVDLFLVSLLHYRSLLSPQHAPPPQLHLRRLQRHLHVLHFFHRTRYDCGILHLFYLPSNRYHSIIPSHCRSLHPSLSMPSSSIPSSLLWTWLPPSPLLRQPEKQIYYYQQKDYF
jgi:hypothetical protein